MSNEYAPLALFVYNRSDLLPEVFAAIEKNDLIEKTDFFIFCDGPKNEADKEKTDSSRRVVDEYVKKSRFAHIEVVKSDKNNGLANSIISGASRLIETYGKVIVLEDDLVISPVFLKFMNDCLDYYESDADVWSIGGTTYGMKALESYKDDVYALWRGESWGWGTWKDRWEDIEWDKDFYSEAKSSKSIRKRLLRGGDDLLHGLYNQQMGRTDSWAIRWVYEQCRRGMTTICPKESLVYNIGLFQGTHAPQKDNVYNITLCEDFSYELKHVMVDKKVLRDFLQYFKLSPYEKMKQRIKENMNPPETQKNN